MFETLDWSKYPDVWVDADRVSGAPCLWGTRLPVEAVVVNFEGCLEEGSSPEAAAEIVYDLFPSATPERVLNLIAFLDEPEQQPAVSAEWDQASALYDRIRKV